MRRAAPLFARACALAALLGLAHLCPAAAIAQTEEPAEEPVVPDERPRDPNVGKSTGLAIPRFVSIRADEANLRVGPGGQYPVRWRLMRSGMPARVVDEEGQWREVALHDGERGWLYAPLLSGARSVYVTAEQAPILAKPEAGADVVAYAAQSVILRVEACGAVWCEVRKGRIDGWIDRAQVWGVLPDERFD